MKISSSHIASCLLALACSSTSLLGAEAPPPPAAERALALELTLAETPNLYLVVHLGERRLEIKARGLVLDSVALADVGLTRYTPLGKRGGAPLSAELPVVRAVAEPDAAAVRKVVTVTSLAPYPESGAKEEPEPATATNPSHSPRAQADPVPPASYRARLDGDWELRIGQGGTRPSLFEHVGRFAVDQARWLVGRPAPGNVILGLAMSAEDARRLHHLLSQGATLLVR